MSEDSATYDDADGLFPVRIARRLCGEAIAAKLSRDFGGTRTYFPKIVSADHRLAKSIGQKNAQQIANECWGVAGGLYIPSEFGERGDRRALVAVLLADGKTVGEIARRTHRSERTIYKDLSALRAAGFKIDPQRHCAPKRKRN